MSRYVLEILDGDQAGTLIPLTNKKLRIGRRSENDLVIHDEKCSGNHAEIEFEDGGYVLRDLGSTNGCLIDGRRITEVALANADVFQLGRVQIRFQQEGATGQGADMQFSRLDQSALPARRGSGVRGWLLVVMLVVACGALAWLQFFAPAGSGLGGPIIRRAVEVRGNLLVADVANLEGDIGWDLQAGGVGFAPAFGRRDANTGSGCIEARRERGDLGYALGRVSEPIGVLAGTTVRLTAYFRTEGTARIAIRAIFHSSTDDSTLRSGSVPQGYGGYQAVDLVIGVPQGMDLLTVEVLALLPEPGSAAFADDFAVVVEGSQQAPTFEMSCRDGRLLRGVGSSFLVRGLEPTLLSVRPLVVAGDLVDLASDDLAVASDVGLQLQIEALEQSGFHIGFTPADESEPVAGMILRFPAESRPCSIAAEDGSFHSLSSEFTSLLSSEVLLGHGASRCLLRFAAPVTLSGSLGLEGYDLEFRGATEFELHLVLDEPARQGRALTRQARDAMASGGMHSALESLSVVRMRYPHDESVLRMAEELRREILEGMERRVSKLRQDAADASFFRSRNGMQRVHQGIAELTRIYGTEFLPQAEALQQLSLEMQRGMLELDALTRSEHAQRLQLLEEAFSNSSEGGLANLVRDYLKRHYPGGGR